jgi:hypothetical protein
MNAVAKIMGRPTLYSPELADEICERIATQPRGLDFICEVEPMFPSARTVAAWIANHPDFLQKYQFARERQATLLFDESLEIADDSSGDLKIITRKDGSSFEVCDTEFVQRSALRVKTRLHMAAVLAPRKYAAKNIVAGADGGALQVEHTVTQTLDLSQLDDLQRSQLREILEAARANQALDVTPAREGE